MSSGRFGAPSLPKSWIRHCLAQTSLSCHVLTIIPEEDLCAGAVLTAFSSPFDVHLTPTAMKLIYMYFNTFDKCKR